MEIKKTHRKYPDNGWEYKAISTKVDDKEIYYHKVIDRGVHREGVEVYSGSNYVEGSKGRNYSSAYKMDNIPLKYKDVVKGLQELHEATVWSNEPYINLN